MTGIADLTAFPWHSYFGVLSFVWGTCIGSFLNVCIHRIPRDLSVVKPRSFCPHCGEQVAWYHNIPLISFVALRGQCCYCRGKISPRYFMVELLTAVLFLLVWLKFGTPTAPRALHLVPFTDWKLIPVYWLIVSGLVLGTFVDLEHLIIPDRVTLGGMAAGILFSLAVPSLHGATSALWGLAWSVLGLAAGWGSLWFIAFFGRMIFRKDAMGFGDVKLMGAIGAFFGWKAVFVTIFLSSLAGSVAGLALVLFGKKNMQSKIPYGPYLALAAVVWMFWGMSILNTYVSFFAPELSVVP